MTGDRIPGSVPRSGRDVFACRRDGLTVLLGGYDGAGGWTARLPSLRDGEQRMVEAHESLHHEFQASTSWGRVSASASMLAGHGVRSAALAEVFRQMVMACRQTHECFATVVSASVVGLDEAIRLLAHNAEYRGYLDRALGLVDVPGAPWQFRETAASAVLRCCMAPAWLDGLVDAAGYRRLLRRDLDLTDNAPDPRLAAFENSAGPGGWQRVFDEILREYPDRGGDQGDEKGRRIPEHRADVERLRAFEEEVLIRRCYDYCVETMDSLGLPSIPWYGLNDSAVLAAGSFRAAHDQPPVDMVPVLERRAWEVDGPEFGRQGITLRDALPAEVVRAATTFEVLNVFELRDPDGDPFVVGVWVSRAALIDQFAEPAVSDAVGIVELTDPVAALIAPIRDRAGRRRAVLGELPHAMTPKQCQSELGEVPLIPLTTLTTLADADQPLTQALSAVEPVYVVMDLPVTRHVEYWLRLGLEVRYAGVPLPGYPQAELSLVVFGVEGSGMRFLSIGTGMAGMDLLQRLGAPAEWPDPGPVLDPALPTADTQALQMAVSTVLSLWRSLGQGG